MIYRIVCDGMDIYGPNAAQSVINPHLEIELNAAGSLEFTLPIVMGDDDETGEYAQINHDQWSAPQLFKSEIDVYEDDKIIWFGRPLQIIRDWNNQRRVVCEGALAYFNDSIQRTWEMKPNKQHTHTNVHFFREIISVHNSQVEQNRSIQVGSVTVDEDDAYRKTDYDTTYDCIQNMCLAVDGGYMILRKERVGDSYVRYIDWVKNMPVTSIQPVSFGLNMLDVNQDLNGADVCTVLIATGKDDCTFSKLGEITPTAGTNWIGHDAHSDEIYHYKGIEKFGRVVQQKSWSEFSADGGTSSGLWHKATDWLEEKNKDITTIEVSAADLHYIGDYSEEQDYNFFQVGMKVEVISSPHGLNDQELIIYKLSMDLDSGIKKVTIGTPPKRELTDIIAPNSGSGSTRGNGSTGGGDGGSGSNGSTYIPVKDVKVKLEEDGDYSSVVSKRIAKIDLSNVGKVQDVKVDGVSVVDEDKVANIHIPVKDITIDGQSIVGDHGIVNLNTVLAGTGAPTSNIGYNGDVYLQLDLNDDDDYYIIDIWFKRNDEWIIYVNDDGVQDVKVNGVSVVDQDGIADILMADPDKYYIAYKIHEYYWNAYIGGSYHIDDDDFIRTVQGTYDAVRGTITFDITPYYQRETTIGAGLMDYFANLGDPPEQYEGRANGSYIVASKFPMEMLKINDQTLTYRESDITSTNLQQIERNKVRTLNIIGRQGINIETEDGSDYYHDKINVYVSSINDTLKPSVSNVYFDDSTYSDNEVSANSTEEVFYYVDRNGTYVASFITNNSYSNDVDIVVYDENGNEDSNAINIIEKQYEDINHNGYREGFNPNWNDTSDVTGIVIVCTVRVNYKIGFKRKPWNLSFKDSCMRLVCLLENIDISNISLDRYNLDDVTEDILPRSQLTNPWRYDYLGINDYSFTDDNGKIIIQNSMVYGFDEEDTGYENQMVEIDRTNARLYPPYKQGLVSYADYFGGAFERSVPGSVSYKKRASVEFAIGPVRVSQPGYLSFNNVARLYNYSENKIGAYASTFNVVLSVTNYDDEQEGYVTEEELEDAIEQLQASFQDGVDDIYDACVAKGSTPASHALSDVVQGILDIDQGGGDGALKYITDIQIYTIPEVNASSSFTASANYVTTVTEV